MKRTDSEYLFEPKDEKVLVKTGAKIYLCV